MSIIEYTVDDFIESCLDHRQRYTPMVQEIRNKFRQGSYVTRGEKRFFQLDRSRIAEIILYPDCEQHWNLIQMICSHIDDNYFYRFGMIIHNSDTLGLNDQQSYLDPDFEGNEDFIANNDVPDLHNDKKKKTHIHLLIQFGEAKTNTAIAKMFGIDSSSVLLFHDLKSRLFYLVHRDQTDKFGYDPTKVLGRFGGEFLQNELTKDNMTDLQVYSLISDWVYRQPEDHIIQLKTYQKKLKAMNCDWFVASRFDRAIYRIIREHNENVYRLLEEQKEREKGGK